MHELDKLLNRKVIFHCTKRDGSSGNKNFNVVHTLENPREASELSDWLTPSLNSIYKKSHGIQLFQPSQNCEEGFKLFNIYEVQDELEALRGVFEENLDLYKEETEYINLEAWLDGLIPIAEVMSSGDKFVLDTFNKKENNESPVIFLDHEAYYSGACAPEIMEVIAQDTSEFLTNILNKPLKYLASSWVGGDLNEQWYPDSISIA